MRITCHQCGKQINSELCSRFCDEQKKEEQLRGVEKEIEKFNQLRKKPTQAFNDADYCDGWNQALEEAKKL